METKKYTTKQEIAAELGANYWALKLLNYLWDYFPEDATDIDFIREKAADAAAEEEKYALKYGTNPVQQIITREHVTEMLFGTYAYALSKHDIVCSVVNNYYIENKKNDVCGGDKWSPRETRDIAIEIHPKLEPIFDKYADKYELDESFAAEPAYDKMVAELAEKARPLIDEIEDAAGRF